MWLRSEATSCSSAHRRRRSPDEWAVAMSTLALEIDPAEPDAVIEAGGTPWRRIAVVAGVPIVAMVVALAIGAVLIARDGENPFAVYADVVRGVFVAKRGLSSTAIAATPLIFIGLGLAIAYRARLFTIGAEGQFVLGAVAAVAFATASGIRDLPGWLLVPACIVIAAVAGLLWSAISAVLANR